MHAKKTFLILTITAAILFTGFRAYAQNDSQAAPPDIHPLEQRGSLTPVERVSPGVFKIGSIMLNKEDGSITFPSVVNMDKGLLEYLLVHSAGKTHESLFRTKVTPYDLQIAFLLLGFEGSGSPLAFQGAPETPKGEPLKITVEYQDSKGKKASLTAEEWIEKRSSDNKTESAGLLDWVFTGSVVIDGRFLAQAEGSIVAIFHDPIAMIDHTSSGGESDEMWYVKEKSVPQAGTPVTIRIEAKNKKK